jgi:hypothetical protein
VSLVELCACGGQGEVLVRNPECFGRDYCTGPSLNPSTLPVDR